MNSDHLFPEKTALSALGTLPDDAPVVMLNLLEFSDDGAVEYARYGAIALPQIEKRGGKVLYSGAPLVDLPEAGHWDRVVLVFYPSRAAFIEMLSDPEYQSGLEHRAAGLKRTVLYAFRSGADSTAPPLMAVKSATGAGADEEIFVLNLLRFKPDGGRAEFQRYGDVVRPMIEALGGGPVVMLVGEMPLVANETWEELILVRYPKLSALQEMVASPAWQAANQDRLRGVDLTWAFPTRPRH